MCTSYVTCTSSIRGERLRIRLYRCLKLQVVRQTSLPGGRRRRADRNLDTLPLDTVAAERCRSCNLPRLQRGATEAAAVSVGSVATNRLFATMAQVKLVSPSEINLPDVQATRAARRAQHRRRLNNFAFHITRTRCRVVAKSHGRAPKFRKCFALA